MQNGRSWNFKESDLCLKIPSELSVAYDSSDQISQVATFIKTLSAKSRQIRKEYSPSLEKLYSNLKSNEISEFKLEEICRFAFPGLQKISSAHLFALHSYLASNPVFFKGKSVLHSSYSVRNKGEILRIQQMQLDLSKQDNSEFFSFIRNCRENLSKKSFNSSSVNPLKFSAVDNKYIKYLLDYSFHSDSQIDSPFAGVSAKILNALYYDDDTDGAYNLLCDIGVIEKHDFKDFYRFKLSNDIFKPDIAGTNTEEFDELESKRHDFGDEKVWTIDALDIDDVDDAISLVDNKDGTWWIRVHVADPSIFIRPGSKIFDDATAQSSTIYLAEKTFTMLPHEAILKCSLEPGRSNRTLSISAKVNELGNVLDFNILPGIISNITKWSYNDLDAKLEEWAVVSNLPVKIKGTKWDFSQAGKPSGYESKIAELDLESNKEAAIQLVKFADKFRSDRLKSTDWAFHILLNKPEFKVDHLPPLFQQDSIEHPRHGELTPKIAMNLSHDVTSVAKLVVAEYMIFAGKLFAEFAKDAGIPIVYRGQESLSSYYRDKPDVLSTVQIILKQYPEKNVDPNDALTMAKFLLPSYLSTNPTAHAILGLELYAQATSPIRRAADLINHWQIKDVFRKRSLGLKYDEVNRLLPTIDSRARAIKRLQFMNSNHWTRVFMLQSLALKPEGFEGYVLDDNSEKFYGVYIPEVASRFFLSKMECNVSPGNWIRVKGVHNQSRERLGISDAFRLVAVT